MSPDTPWIKFLIYFHFLSHPLFQTTSNQLGHMKSLYCDVILFNGWGILWRGVICLRNKVFAAYQFIVSPVDLPKLGPCPLTGVACSLVNKGLVLWDLCCVYTTIHSPVSCVGQRLKPGQCLSLETCGTAFTNLGWIQTKMFPAHTLKSRVRIYISTGPQI